MERGSLVLLVFIIADVVSHSSGQVEVEVGRLPNIQHGIDGTLFLVGTKTLRIKNFHYDGLGPDVFLYYYPPGTPADTNGNGLVIPLSETMTQFDSTRFTGQDLTVHLPDDVTACDIGTLTLWCRAFRTFFTRIEIKRDLFVDDGGSSECTLKATVLPTIQTAAVTEEPPTEPLVFDNCEELDFGIQVRWTLDLIKNELLMQLRGCEAADRSTTDYLAFGISGSAQSVLMFGADPVVAWVDEEGPHAVDYYLSQYSQCRNGVGACPDVLDSSGACTDDVTVLGGMRDNGVQWISFKRPFLSNDSRCDKSIDPTNNRTYVVWGVGPLGETAFKHTRRANSGDDPFHFGRTPVNNCRQDVRCTRTCPPFSARNITALEDTTFVARIGPSGLERGYSGITGRPAWGIAWYINGSLIPELVVQRGKTYTFIVEGGSDTQNIANYHPLYITDSIKGGWSLNTKEEQIVGSEKVFAGFDVNGDVTGVTGRRCNYEETDESNRLRQVCSTSLKNYTDSLTLTCDPGPSGVLTWTPDNDTPDLVYYQCVVHLNLGWKIHVKNSAALSSTTVAENIDTTENPAQMTETSTEQSTPSAATAIATTPTENKPSETTPTIATHAITGPSGIPFTEPTCPVECTYRYCTAQSTRRNLCSNPKPAPSSNCTACHLTYCRACYNSLETITSAPGNCQMCTKTEVANLSKCFRRWTTCVRRAHAAKYERVRGRLKTQENFACYNPICTN